LAGLSLLVELNEKRRL